MTFSFEANNNNKVEIQDEVKILNMLPIKIQREANFLNNLKFIMVMNKNNTVDIKIFSPKVCSDDLFSSISNCTLTLT